MPQAKKKRKPTPKLIGNYIGGYSYAEAAADARAIAFEDRGGVSKRFTKTIIILPATPAEVRASRKALHVSQAKFANLLGVSLPSVKAWERGARRPDGVASRVIRLLKQEPSFRQLWQA